MGKNRLGPDAFHGGSRWHADPMRRRDQATTDLDFVTAIVRMHEEHGLGLIEIGDLTSLSSLQFAARQRLLELESEPS